MEAARLLSDEQLLLRESARDFLAKEHPMSWVRAWCEADAEAARALAEPLWQRMAELGWLGLLWPEDCGGVGLGFVEQSLVLEELGRALLPSPYLSTLVAGSLIDLGAEAELRRELLTAVSAGERVLGFALAEAGGEDPVGFTAEARPAAAGSAELRLSGSKLFVPDAPVADQLLVAAQRDSGLSWLLVEGDAPGIEITPLETMDATRPLYRVDFDDTPARGLGEGGDFERLWRPVQARYWTALAAESVGGSQRVLEDSVAYARERVQFDRPIGANQAIKHRCADMLVRVEGARAITYHAARELAAGAERAFLTASMAKCYATEAYREVAGDGIQIHGGVGFTWEYDCHLFYKRARALEITAGHPDEHRERVAAGAGL